MDRLKQRNKRFFLTLHEKKSFSAPAPLLHDAISRPRSFDLFLCASKGKLRKEAIKSKSEVLFDAYQQMRNKVNKVNIDLK